MISLPIAMPVVEVPPLPASAPSTPEQDFAALIGQLLSQIPTPGPPPQETETLPLLELPKKTAVREPDPEKEREIKPALAVPVDMATPLPLPVPALPDSPAPHSTPTPVRADTPARAPLPKEPVLTVAIQDTPVTPHVADASPRREPELQPLVHSVAEIEPHREPDHEAVKAPAPVTSIPNFPVHAEQAKHQPPPPPVAPPVASVPEPPPEKPATQPVRSVALEFTPDGTHDVRVRLAERSGEVHVSVHSADPTVTRDLRDGVTDLASVLAHAGYDARAWTSDRQDYQGHQHARDQRPPHRERRHHGNADEFDGALQEGIQEVSTR